MWVLACMLRPRHACDAGKHARTAKGAAGRAAARLRRGQSKYRGVTRHHQQGRWEARPPAGPSPARARLHAMTYTAEPTCVGVCRCPVGVFDVCHVSSALPHATRAPDAGGGRPGRRASGACRATSTSTGRRAAPRAPARGAGGRAGHGRGGRRRP